MDIHRFYPRFECDYGYFTEDGYEYVITRPDTPRPWANIICNGDFGLAITQAGGGFSWRTHVSMNRLTRWQQDLIRDDWGKWLYLRDLDSGDLRSLAYQPMQAAYDHYEVRHGLGYSRFIQNFDNVESDWHIFAACQDPVEIWMVTLRNKSNKPRRFQLTSYFEWNLGAAPDNHREFHKLFIDTSYIEEINTLAATKLVWEVPTERGHWNTDWPYVAFHTSSIKPQGWDTSKDHLLGRHGGFHNPKGIRAGHFTGQSGRFQDAAASLAPVVSLAPGEEQTVVMLLGQVDKTADFSHAEVKALVEKYNTPVAADAELRRVKDFWRELTSRVQVETPDPAFDLLNNIWLKYQFFSGHLWGRTGYYQQSGAFGYRDQLQTSQAWLPHEPAKMLEQAKLNARHQFAKGTVLHWWHPLTDTGLVTDMTDDLLWLPYMLLAYFREVGNYDALLDEVPFYDEGSGSLQEHCIRAIDVVLGRFSKRGLPLIGAGDWCDGFSAVGLDWQGESIWLGMFLYDILNHWSDILTSKSPAAQADIGQRYRDRASQLKSALNEHAWNGKWYICATKDDGTPMGDPSQDENKIYLNSQTWAIMSGVAGNERQQIAAEAILTHLEGDNGTMLFQPGYSRPDKYIGYITRYAPGLRENGGVYTHAATWSVKTFAQLKRPQDAMRLFNKLNPILQAQKDIHRYMAEPYVLPGNIDGKDSPYYGRAGWTWYTGSAGWLFMIALESLCGIRATPDGLLVEPCLPPEWKGLKVKRRFRGAVYQIEIQNSAAANPAVRNIRLNDLTIDGNLIPPQPPGYYNVLAVME